MLFQLAAQQVKGTNVKLKSREHERENCVPNNHSMRKKVKKNGEKFNLIFVDGMGMGMSMDRQRFGHRPC